MPINPEALTDLANAKLYLGITGTSDDTLLEELIDKITATIESFLGGRRIKKATIPDEEHDGGEKDIFLNNWPVALSPALTASFRTGTLANPIFNSFNIESFIVYPGGGFVHFFGKTPIGSRNLRFTYDGGFDTIPEDLELVAKQLISLEFSRRTAQGKIEEAVEGSRIRWAGSTTQGTLQSLITAEQKQILNKYRRYNVGQNL